MQQCTWDSGIRRQSVWCSLKFIKYRWFVCFWLLNAQLTHGNIFDLEFKDRARSSNDIFAQLLWTVNEMAAPEVDKCIMYMYATLFGLVYLEAKSSCVMLTFWTLLINNILNIWIFEMLKKTLKGDTCTRCREPFAYKSDEHVIVVTSSLAIHCTFNCACLSCLNFHDRRIHTYIKSNWIFSISLLNILFE